MDDEFVPKPVPPMQKAIPVGQATGKKPGVYEPPPSLLATAPGGELHDKRNKDSWDKVDRSKRAKLGWEKRRLRQEKHQLPDRHATGELTVMEAIELARLIDKYPVIRKILGA